MAGELNAVANMEGQGRKDFDSKVFAIARQSSRSECSAVRILCQKAEESYLALQNYAKTAKLDFVDPQLRNNSDLTSCLSQFEEAYILVREHLSTTNALKHLSTFSSLINKMAMRYPEFQSMIDSCDTQLFLTIPALVVLYDMESIVLRFAPSLLLRLAEISREVRKLQNFRALEMDLLEIHESGQPLAQRIKSAGVQLMRENAE